jgi:hypothetical protein
MHPSDWFAERSARGMLVRGVGGWVFVGLPVIAARVWWSPVAAIVVFVLCLGLYVAFALRYMCRH